MPRLLSGIGISTREARSFTATIIAAIIGTLVMGLFANVPYAQAAGMGLNAFFTYTVSSASASAGSRPCAWCSCAA